MVLVFVAIAALSLALNMYIAGEKQIAREIEVDSNGSETFKNSVVGQTFRADYPSLAIIRIKTSPQELSEGATGELRLYKAPNKEITKIGMPVLLARVQFTANPGGESWHEFVFTPVVLDTGKTYFAEIKITDKSGREVKWLTVPDNGIYFGQGYLNGHLAADDFMLQPVYSVSVADAAADLWSGETVRFTSLLPGSVVIILLAGWLAAMGLLLSEVTESGETQKNCPE